MILIIAIVLLFSFYKEGDAKVEVTINKEPPTILESISFYAKKYAVDEIKMVKLANCESGLKPNAINKADPQGGSIGLFQFQPSTFERYSKEIGEEMDIWSYQDQSKVTAYMISKGQIKQWSCSRKI